MGSDFILYYIIILSSRLVSGTEQKNSTFLFLPWMSLKATERLTAAPPDCNQTAMGLPPVTSAVFLIAKSFW
jgi:hypothetical protein